MGCDTIGKLRGHVDAYEIVNYIEKNIDPDVKHNIQKESHGLISTYDFVKKVYNDSKVWEITSGYISFKDKKGDPLSIFYFYQNINTEENLDYYTDLGLYDMVEEETTQISMRTSKQAKKIIRNIVSCYGGWVDDNDCDAEPFYEVPKTGDNKCKIIHITRKELNEKFGGIVIIDD